MKTRRTRGPWPATPPPRRGGALARGMRWGRRGAALLVFGLLALARGDVLIDNFERPNAPAPWAFSNGPEFPGATGSLTRGVGHAGQGAHLAYDLSHGGHYVSANLSLPSPLAVAAIGFWVKSPPDITIVLRVTDATGQTLQYDLRRPLAGLEAAIWYQQVVPLDAANGWWGGANDGQVHLPLHGLAILAADPPLPGAVGAIDFDDVTGLTSAVSDLDPAQPSLMPAPAGAGDFLSRLGVNIHFTSDNRALDAAQAAGLAWVRMDLIWSAVERSPRQYDWTAYDGLIAALAQRQMKALLILDYGNALYTGANNLPPTTSAALAAFGDFAAAAAQHFAGSGARFEIWNEPNTAGFWPPAAQAAQYAALAHGAVPRVHQGDPNAQVVTGGLSGFDFRFATNYLSLGGGNGADAVGVHPYDCNPPDLLTDRLLLLRGFVAQYVTNAPPVWDTEWGFSSAWFGDGHSSAARQQQAVRVAQELLFAGAAGFPLIIYYDLRDDGMTATNVEHNFGLLANDYTEKPAMQAVKALASVARGRRFSGFLEPAGASLVALRFDGLTNTVLALSTFGPVRQATVTVPTNATATDCLGAPLALLNWTNRLAWTLQATNGPIYVWLPEPGQAASLSPLLHGAWQAGAGVTLTFDLPTGLPGTLLASTNLTDWSVRANLFGSGPTRYLDTQSLAWPRRYYQLRVGP